MRKRAIRNTIAEQNKPALPTNLHSPKPTAIRWREVPMLRMSMAFIPGMIVATLTGIPMVVWLAAFFSAILISIWLLITRRRPSRATIAMCICFSLGGLLSSSHQDTHSTEALNARFGPHYRGVINDIVEYSKGHRATMRLISKSPNTSLTSFVQENSVEDSGPIKENLRNAGPSHGQRHRRNSRSSKPAFAAFLPDLKVLTYFVGCGHELSIGDTITFSKSVKAIKPPFHEFEFDMARYYGSLGIYHRLFLRPSDFSCAATRAFSLRRSGAMIRTVLAQKIKSRLSEPRSAAITIAMLLGDKSNIDSRLRTSYSKSGSIHILAISGLHIGIIASMLIGLIGLPIRQKHISLAVLKACAILSGVWSFTWLSGMPPSAARAAFMFTVYLIGVFIMRKAQILNILGFTAICLLVAAPHLLQNLGFQFSFLALTGIVIWGIPLMRSITFKYRLQRYAWGIFAISVGAQMLVAPAIVYYFNEISVISPFTSLIAIPAAYLIVGGGMLMLFAELVSPVFGIAIGSLLSYVIELINQIFFTLSEFSMSTLSNIFINAKEIAILALLLSMLSLRLLTKRAIWVTLTIPLSVLFAISHCHTYLEKTSKAHLTLYASTTAMTIDIFTSSRVQTNLIANDYNNYIMQDARRNRQLHYTGDVVQLTGYPDYSAASLISIKVFNDHSDPVQILYVGMESQHKRLPVQGFTQIILAKGMRYGAVERIQSDLRTRNIAIHDMGRNGAFNFTFS